MKTLSFIAAFFTISVLLANGEPPVNKPVKVSESTVNWVGYKVLGKHMGNIKLQSGNLQFEGDNLTGGEFVIDMTSINVTDLEGESKGKLEGHLKSDDFFGVNNYSTATLKITNVISRGKPGEYKIIADLTIKETTKPIKFNVNLSGNKAVAAIKVDRSEFDVKYGSGSFFDNLGDNTIYDEFDLNVELAF